MASNELDAAKHLSAQYEAKLTPYVILSCLMAGSGGLMYGYDLVVAGGIGIMDDFLAKFYPEVLVSKRNAKQDNYCKYRNDVFQLFSSCLYIAALLATFLASFVTRRYGRRPSMLIAGLLFMAGTAIGTSAQNLGMLLSGRILLGCGLGFSNQAVPLYLSEIAPAKMRGALNYLFVVYASLGGLSGNIVNYVAAKVHPWGWRLSLGAAGVPAILLTTFSLLLVETPTSLIQRGHYDEAKRALAKIRGHSEVESEFQDLLEVSSESTNVKNPLRSLLTKRRNVPYLIMGMAFPLFQQLAGNDAIAFYGTFLFKIAGFGDQAALYSAIITGAVGFVSVSTTIFIVDRCGRRPLLLGGASIMIVSMVVLGIIFAVGLPGNTQELPHAESILEVFFLCCFIVAFLSSIGPLAWLIPSEIYPLQVRSAGLSVTVFVNMLFKFLIAQTFLSMLCIFKYGVFLFFGGCMVVMMIFVTFFFPETKGIPIDGMQELWSTHWFWKRFVSFDNATKYHDQEKNQL